MSDPDPKSNLGATIFVLGYMGLILVVIFGLYQGYLHVTQDILMWDDRSTYTVGLSLMLLIYALIFLRTLSKKEKVENDDTTEEIDLQRAKVQPILTVGISAVMIFLLGCILLKNKDVWHLPGEIGLSMMAVACILIGISDYLQYKFTQKRFYLFLIPIWFFVFCGFIYKMFANDYSIF